MDALKLLDHEIGGNRKCVGTGQADPAKAPMQIQAGAR
jgi:hypothetical protein